MHNYKFVGIRENTNEAFYIDGVNISSKEWYSTGVCVAIYCEKDKNSYVFSEYYVKKSTNEKMIFVAGKLKNSGEAFYKKG